MGLNGPFSMAMLNNQRVTPQNLGTFQVSKLEAPHANVRHMQGANFSTIQNMAQEKGVWIPEWTLDAKFHQN